MMQMMATGGALLDDDNCKEVTRNWIESGVEKTKNSNTPSHLFGILSITMQWMITIIFTMLCH